MGFGEMGSDKDSDYHSGIFSLELVEKMNFLELELQEMDYVMGQ